MPCPYFYPQIPVSGGVRILARVPLGVLYEGDCHAAPVVRMRLAADHCNFGYGKRSCEHFPGDADADAVRFSISASRDVVWILEKDFTPLRHGPIKDASPIVRRQAEVFLERFGAEV